MKDVSDGLMNVVLTLGPDPWVLRCSAYPVLVPRFAFDLSFDKHALRFPPPHFCLPIQKCNKKIFTSPADFCRSTVRFFFLTG